MMQEKINRGDIYAQHFPDSCANALPEYVKITDVFGDGRIHFIIYTVMFDELTSSFGEGFINQLLEGLKDGDIRKVDEEEFLSFICIHSLIEG